MSTQSPIAWVALEDAIHDWVVSSTGLPATSVVHTSPRDTGAWTEAAPAALIETGVLVPLYSPEERRISQIMQQRYTVIAGAGEVGVDFYLGSSLTPTRISVTALAEDVAADTAVLFLAELGASLPTGVTAAADPDDTASVLVTGSASAPLFAAATAGSALLTVTTLLERFATLLAEWSRLSWRITFRSPTHNGHSSALAYATKARIKIRRLLSPVIHVVGWRFAGNLAITQTPAADRSESAAIYDFALEGYATEAIQAAAIRAIGSPEFVAA